MQHRVDNDGVMARLVRDVVGDEHLLRVEDPGERERVSRAGREAEVLAVTGDLAVVHAAEAQRLLGPHHIRDLGDLLVDTTLSVEQASVTGLVEQGPAYLVVSAGARDPLLVPVVDAWRPEGAEQESHGRDDLIVIGLFGEAAAGLPEGVVIADES